MAKDKNTLQRMMTIITEIFEEHGLKVNPEKTETLILNWKLGKENQKDYPSSILTTKGEEIKNSEIGNLQYAIIEYSQRKSIPLKSFSKWVNKTNATLKARIDSEYKKLLRRAGEDAEGRTVSEDMDKTVQLESGRMNVLQWALTRVSEIRGEDL